MLAELDQNALAGGSPRVRSVRGVGIIRRDGRGARDGMRLRLRDRRGMVSEEVEEEERGGSGGQMSIVLVDEVGNTGLGQRSWVRVLLVCELFARRGWTACLRARTINRCCIY